MKMHIALFASALLMLSSCASVATISQSASNQRFDDGIYYNPAAKLKEVQIAASKEVSALAEKTKNSSVFKSPQKLDTLIVQDPAQFNTNIVFAFDPFYSWMYTGAFATYFWFRPWAWRYDFWYWDRWAWFDPYWGPWYPWGPGYWRPGYWGPGYWGPGYWGPGWGPGYVYIDPTPRVWKSPSSRPNFRSQDRPGFRAGSGSGGSLGTSRDRIVAPLGQQITSRSAASAPTKLVRGTSAGSTQSRLVSERSISNLQDVPNVPSRGNAGNGNSTLRTVNRTTINSSSVGGGQQATRPTATMSSSSASTNRPAISRSASPSSVSRPVASARPSEGEHVSRISSGSGVSRTTINSSNMSRSGNVSSYRSAPSAPSSSISRSAPSGGGFSGGGGGGFRSAGGGAPSGGGMSHGGGGGGISRSPR